MTIRKWAASDDECDIQSWPDLLIDDKEYVFSSIILSSYVDDGVVPQWIVSA